MPYKLISLAFLLSFLITNIGVAENEFLLPAKKPSFFKKLNLKNNCKSLKVNIKNLRQIQKIFSKEKH